MEFTVEGKRFVLREANPSSKKMINNKTFTDTIQQGAQLWFYIWTRLPILLKFLHAEILNSPVEIDDCITELDLIIEFL